MQHEKKITLNKILKYPDEKRKFEEDKGSLHSVKILIPVIHTVKKNPSVVVFVSAWT